MMQTVYLVEGDKNLHEFSDVYLVAAYFDRQAAELHIRKAMEESARLKEEAARHRGESPHSFNEHLRAYLIENPLVWDPQIVNACHYTPFYEVIEIIGYIHPDQWQDARQQQPPR